MVVLVQDPEIALGAGTDLNLIRRTDTKFSTGTGIAAARFRMLPAPGPQGCIAAKNPLQPMDSSRVLPLASTEMVAAGGDRDPPR